MFLSVLSSALTFLDLFVILQFYAMTHFSVLKLKKKNIFAMPFGQVQQQDI